MNLGFRGSRLWISIDLEKKDLITDLSYNPMLFIYLKFSKIIYFPPKTIFLSQNILKVLVVLEKAKDQESQISTVRGAVTDCNVYK